jgi:uncharacterized protein
MSAENIVTAPRALGTVSRASIDAVEREVHQLCLRFADRLQFHGWHHVSFVRAKAVEFAAANGSDAAVVETAALVHDVNYIVRRNSGAAAGRRLRLEILACAGVDKKVASWIDRIIR